MEKIKGRAEKVISHPAGIALLTLAFLYAGKILSMFLYRLFERMDGVKAGMSADITSFLMAALVLCVYLKRTRRKDGNGKWLRGRQGSLAGKKNLLQITGAAVMVVVSLGALLLPQTEDLFTIGRIFRSSFRPVPGRIFHYAWSAALTAVWEELLFRGIVVSVFFSQSGGERVWTTALVSSFFFALGHSLLNPVQIFSMFCFGMLAFAACYAAGSLWPGILLHFITNFIGWIAEDGLTDRYVYRTVRILSEGEFRRLYNRFHFVTYAQVWYFLKFVIFLIAVCVIFVYTFLYDRRLHSFFPHKGAA